MNQCNKTKNEIVNRQNSKDKSTQNDSQLQNEISRFQFIDDQKHKYKHPINSTYYNSDNSKYKIQLCRNYISKGFCQYGQKCQYAHGREELRKIHLLNQNEHEHYINPQNIFSNEKYKTKECRTFFSQGYCDYGQTCNYSHHRLNQQLAYTNQKGKIQSMNKEFRQIILMAKPISLLARIGILKQENFQFNIVSRKK